MLSFTTLVFTLLGGTPAFAQEQGSSSAYRVIAGAAQAEIAREMNWQNDKRLSPAKLPANLPIPENDSLNVGKLEVGQEGRLDYFRFEVLSIHDADEVLLKCGSTQNIWLQGIPTKDLTDKQYVRICGFVEVAGTHEYESVVGKRTVPLIKFLEGERLKQLQEKAKDEEFAAASREWKDKTGEFSIQAIYKGYAKSSVTLEKRDGKAIQIKLLQLSSADNRWIRDQIRKEREASEKESGKN